MPNEREVARKILLEQCGTNIPAGRVPGVRLHFAVLKRSDGRLAELAVHH
jgi:hypothetical protein